MVPFGRTEYQSKEGPAYAIQQEAEPCHKTHDFPVRDESRIPPHGEISRYTPRYQTIMARSSCFQGQEGHEYTMGLLEGC